MTRLLFTIGFTALCFRLSAQDSLFQVAIDYFENAEYENALSTFRLAGDQFRESNRLEEYATCNLEMALCHTRMAAYGSSIQYASNVLGYVEEMLPENQFLKAEGARIIGEDLLHLGRSEEAIEKLKIAEALYPRTSQRGLDECYNLLGLAYANTGNVELAIQYHQQALSLRVSRLGENSLETANSLNNIGLIYIYTDPGKATEYFERVLPVYESEYGKSHPRVAFAMINLAQSKSELGRYFDAVALIMQAQQIWEDILPDDHPNRAFTLSVYGRILLSQRNYDEALHQQENALQMYVTLFGEKHPDVANAHFLIGEVYQRKEDYREAALAYQKAIYANLPDQNFTSVYELPNTSSYLNADYLLSALVAKAGTLEALHFEQTLKARELKSALDTYSVADQLLNELRRIRLKESDKIKLGTMAQQIYESAIRICLVLADQPFARKKYNELAFRFVERSKASVLLGAIQDTRAKSFAGIPEELLITEDSLKTEITSIQEKISRGENIENNQQDLFDLQQVYFELIESFERDYPKYYELKYASNEVNISTIQKALTDRQALLIYYQGIEEMYIFTVTSHKLHIGSFEVSDELRHSVSGMRNGLKFNHVSGFESSSKKLYSQLLPALSKGISQLIILPDGILNSIPFEALYDSNSGKYLVQSHNVSYDFSTSLMHQRTSKSTSPPKSALLLAPINFTSANMTDLPGTKREVNDIRYLMKSNQFEPIVHTGSGASETFIKTSDLTSYRYLHFATHGLVNESKPELSRIFLSGDTTGDGSLYAGDIYSLEINADLVSLSACETGLGRIEQGEGVLGLSRALLFAGARNLLVSQWQVSDASTAKLMLEFYHQHLITPETVPFSQALRKAKLDLIDSENYSSPYYWAPFILVGR